MFPLFTVKWNKSIGVIDSGCHYTTLGSEKFIISKVSKGAIWRSFWLMFSPQTHTQSAKPLPIGHVQLSSGGSRSLLCKQQQNTNLGCQDWYVLFSVKDYTIHELLAVFSAGSTDIQLTGRWGPGHCLYELQITLPGQLVASGDISARFWLQAGLYSKPYRHPS